MMNKFRQKTNNRFVPGYFLLKDNECTESAFRGYEKGIIINDKFYLDLDSLFRYPVSLSTAQAFSRKFKHRLPTVKQMKLLEENLEKINRQLIACGLGECMVMGNLQEEYWLQNSIPDSKDRRRMLFIVPLYTKKDVSSK